MSISKIKDSAGVTHDINATTVNNLHLLDQSYAYVGSLSINVGCVNAVVITGKTESEIFALTGNLYGKLYLASDTGKYWRRKDTQTTAGQARFRDDTTACTNSLDLPDQLTTEDAIYVRINLNQKYYSQLPKFFVTASYDNINGSTSITGFCRQQNQFEITSCAYNGNNLVGVYQPTANTDVYIFKFTKFRSSYGATSQCNVTPVIYYNYYSGTPTIDFITKDDSDYNTIKNYAYIGVPSFGIVGTSIYGSMYPISSGSYDLGRSGDRWRNLYLSGVISNGTYNYTLPSKNGTIALTSDIDDTNTWRKVQLDGVDKLGNANSTNPLNIKAGSNVSITESGGTFTFNATDTTYSNATTTTSGLMSSTDKKVVDDVKALMEGQSDQLVDNLSDVLEVLENWNEGTTLASELNKKVDKVDGKGLSTNDYTTTEKNKLAGIASGAEVNVQVDWTVTDTSSDAYIKNKPSIPENVSDLVNDAGYTTNTGTITGITMNGASKGTSGVVDLGTVLTEHQDISGKLDKTTFEWNKQLSNGSNGKVCLGKFFMYDSNVTINMTLTTSVTYNATVVIRSQNLNREGSAGGINVDVYNDPKNTITPLLTIFRPEPNTASGSVEVYANLGGWSKCLVHVQGVGLETKTEGGSSHTGAYDILTNVSDIPTEVENKTLVTPRNMLTTTFQPLGSYLTTTGTAVNSAKLNNQDASYYLNYNNFTNTPTIPTKTSELTNDSNFISEETQPDWNQTDTTATDFIKNKSFVVWYGHYSSTPSPGIYTLYADLEKTIIITRDYIKNFLKQCKDCSCIIYIRLVLAGSATINDTYCIADLNFREASIDSVSLGSFEVLVIKADNSTYNISSLSLSYNVRKYIYSSVFSHANNSFFMYASDSGDKKKYHTLGGYFYDASSYVGYSGLSVNSKKLNGEDYTYYLDYNNFINTPTVPEINTLDITQENSSTPIEDGIPLTGGTVVLNNEGDQLTILVGTSDNKVEIELWEGEFGTYPESLDYAIGFTVTDENDEPYDWVFGYITEIQDDTTLVDYAEGGSSNNFMECITLDDILSDGGTAANTYCIVIVYSNTYDYQEMQSMINEDGCYDDSNEFNKVKLIYDYTNQVWNVEVIR